MIFTFVALGALLLVYAAAVGAVLQSCGPWRRLLAVALPLLLIALLWPLGIWLSPLQRLLFSTALMLGLLKCAVALRRSRAEIRAFSRLGLAHWGFPTRRRAVGAGRCFTS